MSSGVSGGLPGGLLTDPPRGLGRVVELVRSAVESGVLDRCLVHQHNGNVVFHRIHSATLRALQALRAFPVCKGLLARRANQNFQQLLGNHEWNYTLPGADPLLTETLSDRGS